jgi:ABC-2 type transport system ATP-binding protein
VTEVVSASGLVKRWGTTTALAGADVEVGSGVTGLLGSNGAGKTTLIGMLLGLHPPDAGTLRVLGLDPTRVGSEVRERVGYAPEHDALPPDVRAHDLVRHLAEVHGLPHREAVSRASDALWHVGLGEERFRPVGTMSTGQRQRVKLAAAFVHDPALLLLDEPTNGLDPVQRDEMLALVRRIGTEFGIDVVLSSHLLEEVERVCDAVVILADGVVAASGSLASLRTGEDVVVVDVVGDPAPLADGLRRAGATVEVAGSRITVAVPGDPAAVDAAYDAIRDAAVATGTPLRRLQRRIATLEEVFLAASADRSATAPVLDRRALAVGGRDGAG